MKPIFHPFTGLIRFLALLVLGSLPLRSAPVENNERFFGSWALTLPDGAAGWLEIKKVNGWFDGSVLWGGGSVMPLSNVTFADGMVTLTRVRAVDRKDSAGNVVLKQTITTTMAGKVDGDTLTMTRITPRADNLGFDREPFTGKRLPPPGSPPRLADVKFGAPISVFNGRDLIGWRLIEARAENGWSVENGTLVNRPAPQVKGQPRRPFGNLRTDQEFEDFNLKLQVNVPAASNSGIYLRGIYEIQVLDSYGKPLDSHHMGGVYSRITPTSNAERPPGEWQDLDVTLVARHVTVVLNGKTIIDNQPLPGCTGGALWADPFRPGPLYLQGDHGAVSYRNIVVRPVVR